FRRPPVRGPTRVSDAVIAGERTFLKHCLEISQLAFGAPELQVPLAVNYRNAGRIVAAVFEFPQAVDNQRHHRFFSNVSDYSTHKLLSSKQQLVGRKTIPVIT